MYSGITLSYIDCGIHVRNRQELYMDISLPIRGKHSLQECLKEYMKPEEIEAVQCEECQQKKKSKKGMKFVNFPNIITIQLNRFQLNYDTFQRQKVNDFLYYPEILEMEKFLKPYQEIQISQLPKGLEDKAKIIKKEASQRTTDIYNSLQPAKAGKLKRKGSDTIDQIGSKEAVKFFDQQMRDKRQNVKKDLTKQQIKEQSKDIISHLKSEKAYFDQSMQRIKEKQLMDIQNDMLFGTCMKMPKGIWQGGSFDKTQDIGVGASAAEIYSKQQTKFQHEQLIYDPTKQYPNKTYALYAVLVHAGGAYGGHYYAYIFDGKDWYCFDDASVGKVTRHQVRKYGNFKSASTQHGANAYLLFYRDITTFKDLQNIEIPEDLKQLVNKQIEIQQKFQLKKQQHLNSLTKQLMVKVYTEKQKFQTLIIEDRFTQTISDLRIRLKSSLPYLSGEKDDNWRIRRYDKQDDMMRQVYGNDLNDIALQKLGMRQQIHIMVQIKTDDTQFEEYDPRKIIIKVNFWKQGLFSLQDKHLKYTRLYVKDDISFGQLYQMIQKKAGYEKPQVIKRNFASGSPYLKFSLQQHGSRNLSQLRFFNGYHLFVQEPNEKNQILLWQEQFENEKHRCLFHYNNPRIGQDRIQWLYFDTRKSLADLKYKIAQKIGISTDNFRIKKSKNAVAELTTFKKKLSQMRMVNTQFLFLQEGKSSKGSVIIRRAISLINQDRIDFEMFQETQIELDLNIITVIDLKKRLSQIHNVPAQRIRIRQFKAYQFGQIFIDRQQLQRIRQKSLIWQQTKSEDQKGIQIYIRVWDIMNFQLGPLQQLFIDPQSSYQEMAFILQDRLGIQSDRILVWKSINTSVERQYLLDCDVILEQLSGVKSDLFRKVSEISLFIYLKTELFLCNQSSLIRIKRAEDPYHAKPQKKYASSGTHPSRGGQASLTITVVKQTQQEEPTQINQDQQTEQKLQKQKYNEEKKQLKAAFQSND